MPEESLKHKTKKGLYWSAAGNFANIGMHFVFGIILARLLTPDAYGVIGMLSVFMAVVSVFVDCGFSQSLIRKQDRTQTDFSTEFYFNIVVGLVGYLILFIASPYIADFYNMPILSPILKVIGLGVILNSICVVQSSQFAIKLDFKTPARISVSTQLFTGVVGIIMAYCGWGVWALVFQQLAGNILRTILLWFLAKWRPTWEFSIESFKYQWGFGSKILFGSLIQQVYDNLYPLVIGKYFDARSLGLYTRAQSFALLPSVNLSSIIGGVTFPILSKIGNDRQQLISIYHRMIRSTAFLVFPLMLGLAAVSTPLIEVLLNDQWYDCIIYLQLLCLALIWQPLSAIHISTLKVIGRTDITLKLEIWKRGAGLISIFGSIPFGVKGMCIAFDIFYIYSFTLNVIMISRTMKINIRDQLNDIIPSLVIAVIMGVMTFFIIGVLNNIFLQLVSGILFCAFFYIITSKIFMKNILNDTLSFFLNK